MVRQERLGFVATVCADGTPNVSPKGTTTVWDDDHLVFADIRSPQTIRNLKTNSSIEINVVDPFLRKGYRFKGTASVLTDGATYEDVLAMYERTVERALERIGAVVLVKVERAVPLISPAYDLGVSEDEVRAKWERHREAIRIGGAEDGGTE